MASSAPLGIRVLIPKASFNTHKTLVLILTFVVYSLYHASRKPPSIVKSVLEESDVTGATRLGWAPVGKLPLTGLGFPPFQRQPVGATEEAPLKMGIGSPLLQRALVESSEEAMKMTAATTEFPFLLRVPIKGIKQAPLKVDMASVPFLQRVLVEGTEEIPSKSTESGPTLLRMVPMESTEEAPLKAATGSPLLERASTEDASKFKEASSSRRGLVAPPLPSPILQWVPFEGSEGTARLGEVDVAFLAAYAVGMFFSGHLGDRLPTRWFLAFGMVGSGLCVCLFGAAYWLNIHSMSYFLVVQMFGGLLQATGWPLVVSVIGNWFGKSKRGLIMGIWNAHTSVGNIVGSLVASALLQYGWGWSFLVPGVAISIGGILVILFLVVDPTDIGLPSPYEIEAAEEAYKPLPSSEDEELGHSKKRFSKPLKHGSKGKGESLSESEPTLHSVKSDGNESHKHLHDQGSPIGFIEAWSIPGVAPFALCLFFSKLVAYTFLYWLPFYLSQTEIQGETLSDSTSGSLSTVFDIGGVVGGILAGHLSDRLNARATVASSFMFLTVPVLLLYRNFGSISLPINIFLLAISGVLVNGPYALITTAVSADLGTHSSLKGNAKALATVTAIIDGTGSIGAALGPLITGLISSYGWNNVFYMLMVSAFISGLLLIRLVITELSEKIQRLGSSIDKLHPVLAS